MINLKQGSETTATHRGTPLTPSLFFLAAFPFRKSKKGGEDLSDKLDVEGLGLDDDDTMDLGEIGGKLGGDDILNGLPAKNEKMDQIEGTVNELKNQVETIGNTSSSMKGQMDSIKKEVESINDSIKSLLCVYEAVSKQYNPFVDQTVPTMSVEETRSPFGPPAKTAGIPVVDEEAEIEMAMDLNAPLDKVLRFDESTCAAPPGLKLKGMELEEEVDGKMRVKEPAVEIEEEVEVNLNVKEVIRPREARQEEAPVTAKAPAKVDSYALRQIYKLVDYQLEKVYTAKSTGEDVSPEEVDMLERWINEFKILGVK